MSETRNHCRHIRPSGHRCASPALRHEHFCYYHHTSRGAVLKREAQQRQGRLSTFELLDFDDRTAIQLNLAEIARRIAAHEIDPRRAGLLLYALQIASCNLPKPLAAREPAQLPETIDELIHDETHGDLALEQEYQSAPREKNLEEILHEQWLKDAEDAAARLAEEAAEHQATTYQGVPHDHRAEGEPIVGGSTINPIQGLTLQAVSDHHGVPHDHRAAGEVIVGGSTINPIQAPTLQATATTQSDHRTLSKDPGQETTRPILSPLQCHTTNRAKGPLHTSMGRSPM